MPSSLIEFHSPLHLLGFDQHLLLATLIAAACTSAVLVALGISAYVSRRSWPYLLVTLALTTLLVRTLVGFLTTQSLIAPMPHHILEHGLDIITVFLLLAAIYFARRIESNRGNIHE